MPAWAAAASLPAAAKMWEAANLAAGAKMWEAANLPAAANMGGRKPGCGRRHLRHVAAVPLTRSRNAFSGPERLGRTFSRCLGCRRCRGGIVRVHQFAGVFEQDVDECDGSILVERVVLIAALG